MGQDRFVNRFKKSRTQRRMNLVSCIHDLAANFILSHEHLLEFFLCVLCVFARNFLANAGNFAIMAVVWEKPFRFLGRKVPRMSSYLQTVEQVLYVGVGGG